MSILQGGLNVQQILKLEHNAVRPKGDDRNAALLSTLDRLSGCIQASVSRSLTPTGPFSVSIINLCGREEE